MIKVVVDLVFAILLASTLLYVCKHMFNSEVSSGEAAIISLLSYMSMRSK